jgi:hypothetical protein
VQKHPIIKEQIERTDDHANSNIQIPPSWYTEVITKFVKFLMMGYKKRDEQNKHPKYMPGTKFPDVQIDFAGGFDADNMEYCLLN